MDYKRSGVCPSLGESRGKPARLGDTRVLSSMLKMFVRAPSEHPAAAASAARTGRAPPSCNQSVQADFVTMVGRYSIIHTPLRSMRNKGARIQQWCRCTLGT